MSVIRVNKTENYTVMSNYHLRDENLSLKAVGLMSWMLSLPDNWNFTTEGIVKCRKEGRDAIRGALKELEDAGYLVIDHGNGKDGKFFTSYTLHEQPLTLENKGKRSKPQRKNRNGKTASEKPTQINTKKANTNNGNTKKQVTNGLNENENKNVDGNGFPEENSPKSANYDFNILRKQIRKLLRENGTLDASDPENPLDAVCYKIVRYFLEKYEVSQGKTHKVVSNRALEKVLDMILTGGETDYVDIAVNALKGCGFDKEDIENHYQECISNYEAMIDRYFETDFNGVVDYGISHFFTGGIIKNRYYEVLL